MAIYTQRDVKIINKKRFEPADLENMSSYDEFLYSKSSQVKAYHDSAIFYIGKGNNFNDVPYGIIRSNLSKSPFKLTYKGLNVYMDYGMLSVYGRQVEIIPSTILNLNNELEEDISTEPNKILIDDFRAETAYENLYVNVFIEVNLNDMTNQFARIYLSKRGGNYLQPSELTRYQNNLYKYDNGIYRVPLVHFQYHPKNSQTPFDDFGYDAPIFDDESRSIVNNVRGTDLINGQKVQGELFNEKEFLGKANNKASLDIYNRQSASNKTDENRKNAIGYSFAKEAERFGVDKSNDYVSIDSFLLSKKISLPFFGSIFYGGTINLPIPIDTTHVVRGYLFFKNFELYATAAVRYGQQGVPEASLSPETSVAVSNDFNNIVPFSFENGKATLFVYGKNFLFDINSGDRYYHVSKAELGVKQFSSREYEPKIQYSKIVISSDKIVSELKDGGENWQEPYYINYVYAKPLTNIDVYGTCEMVILYRDKK